MNDFEVQRYIENVETKLCDLTIKLDEVNQAVRKLAEIFEGKHEQQ